MESTNKQGRCIVRNKDNSQYPYFIRVASGDIYPMDNPLMAIKHETEEEAHDFAKSQGCGNYEIEFVK